MHEKLQGAHTLSTSHPKFTLDYTTLHFEAIGRFVGMPLGKVVAATWLELSLMLQYEGSHVSRHQTYMR